MKRGKTHSMSAIFGMLFLLIGLSAGPLVPESKAADAIAVQSFGASYGEWSARWWEWAFSIPAATNPLLDDTGANCGQGQTGNAWFLAGTFGGTAIRTCTIPAGKALFFPLINVASSDPLHGETTLDLRRQAADFIDAAGGLSCTLDGSDCTTMNLFEFRAQSPIFEVIVPKGGILGNQNVMFLNPMVADGYWILLAPLSPGAHTLVFGGSTGEFSTSVTYQLIVVQ